MSNNRTVVVQPSLSERKISKKKGAMHRDPGCESISDRLMQANESLDNGGIYLGTN